MKTTGSALASIMAILVLAACSSPKESSSEAARDPAPVSASRASFRVAALRDVTAMGMLNLMDSAQKGAAENDYTFSLLESPQEMTARILKGEVDIAAVPCDLAAYLYAHTAGDLKLAAVGAEGNLYLAEPGGRLKTIPDLKGKIVCAVGEGGVIQSTLNYVFCKNGLDPLKDAEILYSQRVEEAAALMREGKADAIVLPQPEMSAVMLQNDSLRIALDIGQEFRWIHPDTAMVTSVLLVRNQVLDQYNAAFDVFLNECAGSVAAVNADPAGAAELAEKFGVAPKAAAEKAIPLCGVVLVRGEPMKTMVSGFVEMLYNQNPAAVGYRLPGEDFYYCP
jgi:NitT/TauT family transport system substrate-binding protein